MISLQYPCLFECLFLCCCAAASTDADDIFNAYKALDFLGLTGQVRLNSVTGTRALGTTNIKVRNLQPGSENVYTDVAQYNATTDSLTFVNKVIYWDGTESAPSAAWPTEGYWESSWGVSVLVVVPLLVCGGLIAFTLWFFGYYKKQKKAREDQEHDESLYRGVSLSYLLESLESDESLETDAHNAVLKAMEFHLVHDYKEDEFVKVKEAAALVKAAAAKLIAAEASCATLKLKTGDKVQIMKRGGHHMDMAEVLEPDWAGKASVRIGGQIKSYKHLDLLKLADVPHFEALAEAQAAVSTSQAKQKQLWEEKKYVHKNSRGNYDPNFYQIKVTPSPCAFTK